MVYQSQHIFKWGHWYKIYENLYARCMQRMNSKGVFFLFLLDRICFLKTLPSSSQSSLFQFISAVHASSETISSLIKRALPTLPKCLLKYQNEDPYWQLHTTSRSRRQLYRHWVDQSLISTLGEIAATSWADLRVAKVFINLLEVLINRSTATDWQCFHSFCLQWAAHPTLPEEKRRIVVQEKNRPCFYLR